MPAPRKYSYERVPRPANLDPRQVVPSITFASHGCPGVWVKDILKNTVVMDSANDLVFEQFGWRQTVVDLKWPGYVDGPKHSPMSRRINVRVDGLHMTRLEFAREICVHFLDLCKSVVGRPIQPGHEKWMLSPDGVRVKDVVLVSVHYYRNVWVPEFFVNVG